MTDVRALLQRTADLASDFLESLDERPVFPRTSAAELRVALGGPLPDEPSDPQEVVERLAAAADPGIVAIPSGRYFGFVIGGGLPAALAADWLTSAWDQNAGLYVGGASASVVEQVVREWTCELLGLPADARSGSSPAPRWGASPLSPRRASACSSVPAGTSNATGWPAGRGCACSPARSATSRSTVRCACSDSARREVGGGGRPGPPGRRRAARGARSRRRRRRSSARRPER